MSSLVDHFPVDGHKSEAPGAYLGISREDWHRALVFMKYHFKASEDKRAAAGQRVLNASQDIAIIPTFLSREDVTDMADEDGDNEDIDNGTNDKDGAVKYNRCLFNDARQNDKRTCQHTSRAFKLIIP